MPHLALPGVSSHVLSTMLVAILLAASAGTGAMLLPPLHSSGSQSPCGLKPTSKGQASAILARHAVCFVPNLGQWDRRARFVHRSGPMTLFLEDRGWVLDLVEREVGPKARPHEPRSSGMPQAMPGAGDQQNIRGVALKMTFDGDSHVPEIIGEKKLPGHHNYFLGNDESRWRTGVPLYGSVRYEDLYPGIDLRLRQVKEVPEYDLLLEAGADLSRVTVHVEGAKSLSIAGDGALVIDTALGPLTQPRPKTWQVDGDGRRHDLACDFTLLGADRFGFAVRGWDGHAGLTIDPSLLWSTFLGTSASNFATAVAVDASGVVTVAGRAGSAGFPTTSGAYDTTYNSSPRIGDDAFITCLDLRKTGAAQLVYSTYLGGTGLDEPKGLAVVNGVVTVSGTTNSKNFPTTNSAYDQTFNGGDVFVSRLDTNKSGSAQLVYSTFLGSGRQSGSVLSVDASGVITVAGDTGSSSFPTTPGAYDRTSNGSTDSFVSRLDPSKSGSAQLVYSTFLGGSSSDNVAGLAVAANGVATVVGYTASADFPTTGGAYSAKKNGSDDVFVSSLDPSKSGSAQLVYSTFLGGSKSDFTASVSVARSGVVTVGGHTYSTDFPTTSSAYAKTHNGGYEDAFISRLDPRKTGAAQLVYSTYFGGGSGDFLWGGLYVDGSGMVTIAGRTDSKDFPTTANAYDRTFGGIYSDAFVSRLDPSETGSKQLVYSTYLGGRDYGYDFASAVTVDGSGAAIVAGYTNAWDFPTLQSAYDPKHNGGPDAFVSRLDMGVPFHTVTHAISISTGGTQSFIASAGLAQAYRSYWIFGSVTGTTPGVTLASATGSVNIPLNPDVWTDYTIAFPNSAMLTRSKGKLSAWGWTFPSINIPKVNLPSAIGLTFHHAYLVYDEKNNFYMASNAVPLKLVK